MKGAGGFSVVILGLAAFIVGLAALNGFMLSYMWEWFVVPLGVRAIAIPQAIGIAVLVSMLTYQGKIGKEDDPEGALNRVLVSVLGKLFAFGIAFGVSFLVPA